MFSVVPVRQSVILFTGGSHVTFTYDALDFTIQGYASPDSPTETTPSPAKLTPSGSDRRPAQICSLEDPLLVTSRHLVVKDQRPVQTLFI